MLAQPLTPSLRARCYSAPRGSTLRLPRASTLRLALLLCASRFHFAPRASQRSPFLPCALLSSERHSLSAGPPSSCSFSFPALLLGARVESARAVFLSVVRSQSSTRWKHCPRARALSDSPQVGRSLNLPSQVLSSHSQS